MTKPTKPKARRYPALPKTIEAAGGTVTVQLVDRIVEGGTECWGLYDPAKRLITIDRTAMRAHQWRTLFHEEAHVWLVDAGLDNGIEHRLHEVICEAIATGRMRAAFG